MQEPSLFKIFTDRLNKLNVKYIVTGSVASIIYGEPRVTHDIDIVINLPANYIQKLSELFDSNEFYLPPLDIIKNEILRENRGHCNIINYVTGFKADIYFKGNDSFQDWALNNSRKIEFYDSVIPIAPVEYVIIKKLEFYKEGKAQKHINDIKSMLRNSQSLIDNDLLKNYLLLFGLEKDWQLCFEE